ncbi:MAG: hypothetical protein KC553_14545 [Nitrospina sp.]|nr:hypothetical protein [Nitrospina sp.]
MRLRPEDKIRIHQAKKAVLKKIIKLTKVNRGQPEDQVLSVVEAETSGLFDQLLSVYQGILTHNTDAIKSRAHAAKRSQQNPRTEHVGRFFIHLIEKELHESELHPSVIPVLARSVSLLIGAEAYTQFSDKIQHLIEFADKHGFDYDQMLASKPGQDIMKSIFNMYRTELKNNRGILDILKNRLDEALVDYSIRHPEDTDFNIEESVGKALNAFLSLVQKGVAK